MQCRNCGFENMPGLGVCARCQSVLALGADVEIHPPRAGRLRFLRPIWYGWRRLRRRPAAGIRARWRRAEPLARGPVGSLFLSLVPGLVQIKRRRRLLGGGLLAAWLVSCFFTIYLYGGLLGGLVLGAALGIHATSVLDALWPTRTASLGESLLRVGSSLVFLVGVVYLPVWVLARHYFDFDRYVPGRYGIPMHWGPIAPGDLLFVARQAYNHKGPERGDLVLFVRRGSGIAGDRRDGRTIGQVAGLPNERVEVSAGNIRVDGRPVELWAWPASWQLPDGFAVDLDAESYLLLFPLRLAHGAREITVGYYQARLAVSGVTRRESILGKVIMIYQPLSRRKRLPGLDAGAREARPAQ